MMKIVNGLNVKYSSVIVGLANHNIRNALQHFRTLLENRRWFQRDAYDSPAFEIAELNFAVNDAGVIRALAMPHDDIYFDTHRTLIANIIHNTADPNSNLLVSYVIRYMLQRVKTTDLAQVWQAFDLSNLFNVVKDLFSEDVAQEKLWRQAIEWMKQKELLFDLEPFNENSMSYSLVLVQPNIEF